MQEVAKINFFNITKAGFYTHNSGEHEFGSIESIFADFVAWVKDGKKTLADTRTFEIEDDSEFFSTYCFDLFKHPGTGDYLLTTWNEVPTTDGQVASVDAGSAVGSADIEMTEIPNGRIPGYATYFWIIPDHNALATIKFQHRLNGHQAFIKYINEYLAKFSGFSVIDENNDEADHVILGYRETEKGSLKDLNPSFKSVPYRKKGKVDYLKANREKIFKVIRKNILRSENNDQKTLLDKFLANIGLHNPPDITNEIHAKYEFDYTPSETELNRIIVNWEQSHETKWDDVGFKITKEKTTQWLSHSLVKNELDIDITRENIEVVNAKSLLIALTEHRTNLISLLNE